MLTVEGEGRFRTLLVCVVKSRKFETVHSGNATRRSRGCIIFRHFVSIIVVDSKRLPCYIIPLDVGWLALLILAQGAMREPDYRDKHGGTNSHVFFISRKLISNNAEFGSYKHH